MSVTGSRFSSDSAPRALPSWGFEDEVEQSFGRPCRQCDGRFKRTYELTSSIVPRETSFHRGVELDFLLLHWILHRFQATATSLVHRNSVPSTHTRAMITANRRPSATIAFLIPRCLATFIVLGWCQSKRRTDRLGVSETGGNIDGDAEGQRDHGTDPRNRHQTPAHVIVPNDGQQAAMQDGNL